MRLMDLLMLSCRKATFLMERRTLVPLGPVQRMQLWMHTSMCDGCRAFQQQIALIDRLLENRALVMNEANVTALEQRILRDVASGEA